MNKRQSKHEKARERKFRKYESQRTEQGQILISDTINQLLKKKKIIKNLLIKRLK